MMTDKDKIIKAIKCRAERNKRCGTPCEETGNCHYAKCMVGLDGEPYYPFVCDTEQLCTDALSLLKEQDERLRKLQKDKDTLCLEVSEWKHKFHDKQIKGQEGIIPYIDIDEAKCPNCKVKLTRQELLGDDVLFEDFYDYCPHCGKPVLWEGR